MRMNNIPILFLGLLSLSDLFVILLLLAAGFVLIGQIVQRRKLRKNQSLSNTTNTNLSEKRIAPNPELVEKLNKELELSGFAYDPSEDIFYSTLNCWQRKYGYCSLYDESSAALGMIIDCEPIYFNYAGKRWIIELLKGQYGLTTGGEIGIYNTTKSELSIPGFFSGTLFDSASDQDSLQMSFTLIRNGETLFNRSGRHWWLTGFVLGEFSEPSELKMEASISFRDPVMCEAFVEGLIASGYQKEEYTVLNNCVCIHYDRPHCLQPFTRTPFTDHLTQKHNNNLCETYRYATKDFDNIFDKLSFIKSHSPTIYEKILSMGAPIALYDDFDILKNYFP